MTGNPEAEPTRWIIHDERVIDDTRRAHWSIASVELPNGVRFEQYVLRAPRSAMTVVLDDEDRVLMMWRHRFIIDRWVGNCRVATSMTVRIRRRQQFVRLRKRRAGGPAQSSR